VTLSEFQAAVQDMMIPFGIDTVKEHQADPEAFPLDRELMDWWAEVFAYALMHEAQKLIALGQHSAAQILLDRYGIAIPELKADDEPPQSEDKSDV